MPPPPVQPGRTVVLGVVVRNVPLKKENESVFENQPIARPRGAVEQQVAESHAEARAQCRHHVGGGGVVHEVAVGDGDGVGVSELPVRGAAEPLAVGLPAEHDIADLPVEADLPADDGAPGTEPGRGPAVDDAGRGGAPADRIGARRNAVLAARGSRDCRRHRAPSRNPERPRPEAATGYGGRSAAFAGAAVMAGHRDASQKHLFHRSMLPRTHMVNRPEI